MAQDLDRIRLVTERYAELQGLRHVLIGCVFSVLLGGLLLVRGQRPGELTLMLSLVLAFALIVPGMFWLNGYYERSFGRLSPRAGTHARTLIVPATLVALHGLHPVVGAPRFSLYFLGWAAFALWTAWRDQPFRTYWLLHVAAGLLGAAVQWRAGGTDDGYFLSIAAIGAALVLTGTRDHQLLAETLRPSTPE